MATPRVNASECRVPSRNTQGDTFAKESINITDRAFAVPSVSGDEFDYCRPVIAGALGMAIGLAITMIVWGLSLGTGLPHRLASSGAIAGVLLSLTVPRSLAAWLGWPLATSHGLVLGLVLTSGVAVLIWRRRALRWSPPAARVWLGAGAGALVWLCSVIASQVLPGASRIGWVLNGDGLLYLEATSRTLADPTVGLARIPYSVLGLVASPFGSLELSGSSIGHEVYALVIAWALQLAMWCVVCGAAAAALVPVSRKGITIAVASIGSFLPLTAYFAGTGMEWGYVNANLAIPAVLLAWLALSESRRHPFAALSVLAVITSVLWMSWEPLAAIPAVAGLIVAWRVRFEFRTLRGVRLFAVVASALQFMLIFGSNYLSRSAQAGEALAIDGHGLPTSWPGLVVASGAVLIAAFVGRATLPRWVPPSAIGVVAGSATAIGMVLLFTIGDPDGLTGYYPTKLTYFLTVFMFTVAVSLLVGLAARSAIGKVASRTLVGGSLALALLVAMLVAPTAPGLDQPAWRRQPLLALLAGTQWSDGEASVDLFLRLARPDAPGFLWRSGNPDESIINYRVIVTNGGNAYGDIDLRMVAFPGYQGRRASPDYSGVSAAQVCTVIKHMPGVTIYTADVESAREQLSSACGLAAADVPIASVENVPQTLLASQ